MAKKEKIEHLKSIKAGHREVVTRHINEAKTILENRRELGHVGEELTVAQVDRLNLLSLLLNLSITESSGFLSIALSKLCTW